MLVRLRPRPSRASMTSRKRSIPVAPATIVRTKRSCPGTSTSDSRAPVAQLERRVAELDRDAAPLLLRQPVGVLAGQRADEPRLAVVDVPGGADGQRHRASISVLGDSGALKPVAPSSVAPLRLVALAAGEEREHQQVEPLAAVRLVAGARRPLRGARAARPARRGADRAQDAPRALVVPVVEDRREDVRRRRPGTARRSCRRRTCSARRGVSSRTVSGRSKTMPRRPGCRSSSASSSEPLPPPTSTTVSSPRQPTESRRSTRLAVPCSIARSKRGPLVGLLGEPRPEVGAVQSRERRLAGGVERADRPEPDAAEESARSRAQPSSSRSFGGRRVRGRRRARSSAKTPSLASARRKRWSVSGVGAGLPASSATGRGPSASASAMPRSATIASARVASAPWSRSQIWPRARAAHARRRAPRRRPRRPRRPQRAAVEQAATVAHDRRRPAGRPRAAARRAPPRPRTRSSAARRAAARRRRRARPSPRPSPPTSPASRSARARTDSAVLVQHAQRRHLAPRARRVEVERAASPSSAASVSLSARSARCSGWRRSRSTSSARPTTIPACGPPSSLSPEKQTRSAPGVERGRAPSARRRATVLLGSAPEPRSSISGSSCRCGRRGELASAGRSVKPTTRKFDWCTRRSSAVSGPIARS